MPPIDHLSYSFADLSAAGISLRPVEAVTIVRELALRVERGELRGVPSAHVIRLSGSGMVSVGGPMAADSRSVARAAHLLDTLLPPIDAPARVPGALRLVLARALGTLDLPPYPSLDSFAQALSRFASDDLEGTVRALVARQPSPADPPRARRLSDATPAEVYDLAVREGTGTARGAQTHPERSSLTISDIRRARRATGLTLAEISERSHISIRLLRELEWGYLRNWPGSDAGRHQLVRYAHAAGLDDQLVVQTVWPLLLTWEREPEVLVETIPHEPIVEIPQRMDLVRFAPAAGDSRPSTRHWLLAALAIPAVLTIAVAPAVWERSVSKGSVPPRVRGFRAHGVRAACDPAVGDG